MSREHELILELRAARRTVREAEIQEQEARVKVAERKAARMKAAAAVEEILAEMDGTSDRPLIDAINGRAREEPESADERQRGYTVTTGGGDKPAGGFDPPGKPTSEGRKKEGGGRKQLNSPPTSDLRPPTSKKERADRREVVISPQKDGEARAEDGRKIETPPTSDLSLPSSREWTSAELEEELEDACYPPGFTGPGSPWPELKEHGCDDKRILEVLRQIWPAAYRFEHHHAGSIGRTVHGGPTPAFWVGARKSTDWKLAPPTLEWLRLADRVRTVLEIPRARVQPEPEPVPTAADRPPARKRGRKAVEV